MLPVVRRTGASLVPRGWIDREFDRFINQLWADYEDTESWTTGAYPVDVWEDDENVYVEAEVPGFAKDEIGVTLEHETLRITAERKTGDSKGTKHMSERRFSRLHHRFSLSTSVDEAKVVAKLKDGVLHLTLPKTPDVRPQRIKIAGSISTPKIRAAGTTRGFFTRRCFAGRTRRYIQR